MKGKSNIGIWLLLALIGYWIFSGENFNLFSQQVQTVVVQPQGETQPTIQTPPSVTSESVQWEIAFYIIMVVATVAIYFVIKNYEMIQ